MSSAKLAAAGALVAVSLSGCGVAAKPVAGSSQAAMVAKHQLATPLTKRRLNCLKEKHVGFHELNIRGPGSDGDGYPSLQIGTKPSGPTVEYTATPGAAQNVQITGRAQGAEVIGSALVFPNQASDALMKTVNTCVGLGVSG